MKAFLLALPSQNHLPQDSQDLVLGGDVPISSIQATIAKLSIRPLGGMDSPAASLPGLVEPPGLPPASLPESTPVPLPRHLSFDLVSSSHQIMPHLIQSPRMAGGLLISKTNPLFIQQIVLSGGSSRVQNVH